MIKNRRCGFTLIEIMIVVLIIALLLAIAVPNFLKARENACTKSCIGNLRQISHVKEMFAMEHAADADYTVTWSDVLPYLRGGQPRCPAGGTYDLATVNATVTCNHPGHRLP